MSSDFPKRLAEKVKLIRMRLGLPPEDIAPFVGAKDGAEIESYEDDEGDMPVSVLWGYERLSGNPITNLIEGLFRSR